MDNRDTNDIFTECGVDHDGTPIIVKRKKDQESNNDQQQKQQNRQQSTALLDDLTKEESELTQFLLANDNDKSMSTMKANFYSICLENIEVRSERIIMAAEVYAIFGALFINATWILYEWGSAYGYGNMTSTSLAFEFVMAAALSCNIFLAMLGSALWLESTLYSSTARSFVFEAGKVLTYLQYLMICTIAFVSLGVFLGIYSNLSSDRTGTILAIILIVLSAIVFNRAQTLHGAYQFKALPLEMYHVPLWFKLSMIDPCHPFKYMTKRGRDDLRRRAKVRADELKHRAYQTRRKRDSSIGTEVNQSVSTDIGLILQKSAKRLGKDNSNLSDYEARLNEDWINEIDQLKSMSIERLSRYMPYGLAHGVHKTLMEE